MPIILRIAIRNLKEHKLKSIIIISLIALGMIILVIGNSVIDTGKAGIEKAFIQSFTGHILVGVPGPNGENPGLLGTGGGFGPPSSTKNGAIQNSPEVIKTLQEYPGVKAYNPQVYGAMLAVLTGDWRAGIGFMGVDPVQYNRMFPDNIEILEGRFLEPGEEGIVMSKVMYDDITIDAATPIIIGETKLKVQGFQGGSKIKQIPVIGLFNFKTPNSSMQELCFMDLDSLRYMTGMVVGSTDQVKVEEGDQDLLGADLSAGFDSFFDEEVVGGQATVSASLDSQNIYNILGDTSRREELSKADSGAWHYLLLKLEDGSKTEETIVSLNKLFSEKNWDLRAVNWEIAAGAIATFVTGAQLFFFILVFIIAVVCVIVIMNTMVVSIMERTAEIGTMRALGARKSYIRKVFLTETFALSIMGGLIGLLIGGSLIAILHSVGLPSPNSLFDLVFGGKVLYPILTVPSVLSTLVLMVLVGLLSGLYPTRLALKIQPIKAMQS